MNLSVCISELLAVHDCVIIPGFGGFIGNYSPARIDPVHHSFQPPSKKLLFNINLKQNDGLLANYVATYNGISYTDACLIIDEFTETCRHQLKTAKSFVIPNVGRLFSGHEGNVQFEQDKKCNLLPDAYGLTSFISPPISRNTHGLKIDLESFPYNKIAPDKRWMYSRPLKWAAMLAIPIGFATMLGIAQFDKMKTGEADNAGILSSVFSRFSSTSSLVEKKTAPENHPESLSEFQSTPSIFDQAPVVEDKVQPSEEEIQTQPAETQTSIQQDDAFAIIVGAFRSKENAQKYISELLRNGTQASIYDRSKTGLYRVTIGTFSQREEALQLLSSSKSGSFCNAWLLTK
ncbi:MAG: SPOR domain-containing protein [Bacteroidales bacterium]|nr:SPOR domain-containing protein [Bacteroidales bacterium]